MIWTRPGRRALIAVLTMVAALLPVSLIAAVSALGDAPDGGAGPAVVGFSPHEGSIAGGTVVHISGGGFAEVSGVSFGGRPARSFKVKSETVIDAVAPRVPHGATVLIHVAAAGGTAASKAKFAFIGCHVPARLKGDTVAQARRALSEAGCKTGRVRRAHGSRAPLRVIGVTPHAGRWLDPGARVHLRVR